MRSFMCIEHTDFPDGRARRPDASDRKAGTPEDPRDKREAPEVGSTGAGQQKIAEEGRGVGCSRRRHGGREQAAVATSHVHLIGRRFVRDRQRNDT
ncbi:hypothetical protein B0H19DRAFT_1181814 [Mycena capillaripes]|nr:hypothetical protein B0H19DRAFT_1181814 [Mycena capillaripes]